MLPCVPDAASAMPWVRTLTSFAGKDVGAERRLLNMVLSLRELVGFTFSFVESSASFGCPTVMTVGPFVGVAATAVALPPGDLGWL